MVFYLFHREDISITYLYRTLPATVFSKARFIFSIGIHIGRLELIVWHRQGTFLQRKAIQRSLNCRKIWQPFNGSFKFLKGFTGQCEVKQTQIGVWASFDIFEEKGIVDKVWSRGSEGGRPGSNGMGGVLLLSDPF